MTVYSGRQSIMIILLIIVQVGPVWGDEGKPVTLADCIAIALRENRTIRNAYLSRVAQKYDLRVAEDKFTPKAQVTPSVGGSGGTGTTPSNAVTDLSGTISQKLPTGASINLSAQHDITSSERIRPARNFGWNATLTQPLLKGGGININTASVTTARISEQSNILSLKSTLMSTLSSVVTSYRSYIQSIRALEISRQSLERSRDLVNTNRELIAAGRMAAIEMIQSEASVAQNEFSLLSAENAVDAARLTLTKALDIDKNTKLSPIEGKEIPPVPFKLEEGKKLAFENRPDYLSSLLSYESSKIQLAVTKNSTLWDLSLSGGYGNSYTREGAAGSESSSGNWNTSLKLTIPIGDLSIEQGYISAKIALQKMENDLARQRENIEIEVQNDLRNAEMNLRQIKLATQSRVLTEKKVEIETEKLKAGRSTNFQLVSFQNDLVNSQNSELGAIITYLNTLTALENTVGITLDRWGVLLEERN